MILLKSPKRVVGGGGQILSKSSNIESYTIFGGYTILGVTLGLAGWLTGPARMPIVVSSECALTVFIGETLLSVLLVR